MNWNGTTDKICFILIKNKIIARNDGMINDYIDEWELEINVPS